jgi:hypothetical protein
MSGLTDRFGRPAVQVSYASPDELWSSVRSDKDKAWYAPAVEYWDRQPASYDGVLAGAAQIPGCAGMACTLPRLPRMRTQPVSLCSSRCWPGATAQSRDSLYMHAWRLSEDGCCMRAWQLAQD